MKTNDFYIPETVEDFELYSMVKDADIVAKNIHQTLMSCLAFLFKEIKTKKLNSNQINSLIIYYRDEVMYPLLSTYGKWGAGDSEPRFHVKYTFERFFDKYKS